MSSDKTSKNGKSKEESRLKNNRKSKLHIA